MYLATRLVSSQWQAVRTVTLLGAQLHVHPVRSVCMTMGQRLTWQLGYTLARVSFWQRSLQQWKKQQVLLYNLFRGDTELWSAVRESSGDRHQNNIPVGSINAASELSVHCVHCLPCNQPQTPMDSPALLPASLASTKRTLRCSLHPNQVLKLPIS